MARTSKACLPSGRPVRASGAAQGCHGDRSRWHSNPLACPVAEKAKVASWLGTVLSGPESMMVSGRVVSTSGLNQSSPAMAAKAAIDSSELSIRRSSPGWSGEAAGASVES